MNNLQNPALRAAYMADLNARAAAEEARVAEIKKIKDAKIAAYLKAAAPVSEPVPANAAKVKAAKAANNKTRQKYLKYLFLADNTKLGWNPNFFVFPKSTLRKNEGINMYKITYVLFSFSSIYPVFASRNVPYF